LALTTVWNPNGFHIINGLSKGIKFNADHSITDVLILLAEWLKTQVGRTDRKLIVHADNACRYTAKMSLDFLEQNRMSKVLHPPYSPDLVLFDFYLFGHIQQLLVGQEFPDRVALLDADPDILSGIEKVVLDWAFFASMERFE
jgi:hypothetical protein